MYLVPLIYAPIVLNDVFVFILYSKCFTLNYYTHSPTHCSHSLNSTNIPSFPLSAFFLTILIFIIFILYLLMNFASVVNLQL